MTSAQHGHRRIFPMPRTGTRIAIGFTVLLGMLLASGYQAWRNIETTLQATVNLYEQSSTVTRSLGVLRDTIFQEYSDLQQAAAAEEPAASDLAAAARFHDESERRLRELSAASGSRQDTQALRSAVMPFLVSMATARHMLLNQQRADAVALLREDGRRLRDAAHAAAVTMSTAADSGAVALAARSRRVASTVTATLVMTVAELLTGAAIAAIVIGSVVRPFKRLNHSLRRLANGDRDIAVPGVLRQDEFGDIARMMVLLNDSRVAADLATQRQIEDRLAAEAEKLAALRDMADTIETETTGILEKVNHQSRIMGDSAVALGESAVQTAASARGAAQAAEQALATVETVASAAEQLAASVQEITGQMGHSAELVKEAVNAGTQARATIETLTETVLRIGAVADMIGEIAARTNLLALNATIEAARAGTAGKGFAVVASEVKQLATQTARSTAEITQQLNAVRGATQESVAAVERIERVITEVNNVSTAIGAAVKQQGNATAEIAGTITQTAAAARTVTARITEVDGEAGRSGSDALRVSETAAGLVTSVNELKQSLVRVVRTANKDLNRRASARYETSLACQAVIDGRSRDVTVTQISAGGVRMEDLDGLPRGSTGVLRIPGVGFDLPFVVLAPGRAAGVAFTFDDATGAKFASFPERLGHRLAA